MPDEALFALAEAVEELRDSHAAAAAEQVVTFTLLQQKRAELKSDARLATFPEVSRSYVTRL